MLLRSLIAGGAGVTLASTAEPLGWVFTAPVAIAALVVCVRGVRLSRAGFLGLLFGIGHSFVLFWWMRAVGTDAWLALSTAQAIMGAPLGLALAMVARLRWWPWWSAVCYVAIETIRGAWPMGGLPWGRLSYTVIDTWWADLLPWVGFAGLSLLIAGIGTSLAWVVVARPAVRSFVPLALLLFAASAVGVLVPWDVEPDGSMQIAVVQGDVPGSGDDLVAVHRQVTANHVNATVELAAQIEAGRTVRPDLVVWPENSTAVDPFLDVEVNAGIERASAAIGVPILVGAMTDAEKPDAVLNQGIVWMPGIGGGDRYTKRHPVPFGEYIPWRDTVFTSNFGKLEMIPRDMLSGTRSAPLRVGERLIADAICFDVAYDDAIHAQVRRGAQSLVVQTSNAMFIRTPQIDQQYAITRLRALETGRSVAVAATNGVSGVVSPDGTVLAEAKPQTTSVLNQDVVLSSRITPAVAMGAWPGRVIVFIGLVACVASVRRRPVDALYSPSKPLS